MSAVRMYQRNANLLIGYILSKETEPRRLESVIGSWHRTYQNINRECFVPVAIRKKENRTQYSIVTQWISRATEMLVCIH